MKRDDILERIRDVMVGTFELEPELVLPNSHLYDDLDLDSLDAIDLAVKLKTETGIKLKEQEMKSIRTVQDIVDVVSGKLEQEKAAT